MYRLSALLTMIGLLVAYAGSALAQDVNICLATAQRLADGETIGDEEKSAAHEACLRALAATSSVVQKYQLQEADFDIMGTRPNN